MPNVYFDSLKTSDATRRDHIYDGSIFLTAPAPTVIALCDFARTMIEAALPAGDPRTAQFNLPVTEFVNLIGPLKSSFTNHPRTKELLRNLLEEFGCDLERTYFDVPRLRVATHGGYLTAGVGYAYRPHRDIWYSSPVTQVNWWTPIYPLAEEQALVFYPSYWAKAVSNSSKDFDYDEWCRIGRQQAASQIAVDTRKHPLAQEAIPADAEVRLVTDAAATICFSSAHLHATAPNTSGMTRFSFDFRTVNLDDLTAGKGAQNPDAAASGTTLGDFIRASDFSQMPVELTRQKLMVNQ